MVINTSLAFGFVDQSHQGTAGNTAIDKDYELGRRIWISVINMGNQHFSYQYGLSVWNINISVINMGCQYGISTFQLSIAVMDTNYQYQLSIANMEINYQFWMLIVVMDINYQ